MNLIPRTSSSHAAEIASQPFLEAVTSRLQALRVSSDASAEVAPLSLGALFFNPGHKGILHKIIGKLLPHEQQVLRLTCRQICAITVEQIKQEEVQKLDRLFASVNDAWRLSDDSQSLDTVHKALMSQLHTQLQNIQVTHNKTPLTLKAIHGFRKICSVAQQYLVLTRCPHTDAVLDAFWALYTLGGFEEVERGITVALQHIDAIQKPNNKYAVLWALGEWTVAACLVKELGARILRNPYLHYWKGVFFALDLSKFCLALPKSTIKAKLPQITEGFQRARSIVSRIPAESFQGSVYPLHRLATAECCVHLCGKLEQMFESDFARMRETLMLYDHEDYETSDRYLQVSIIFQLEKFGLFDLAQKLHKEWGLQGDNCLTTSDDVCEFLINMSRAEAAGDPNVFSTVEWWERALPFIQEYKKFIIDNKNFGDRVRSKLRSLVNDISDPALKARILEQLQNLLMPVRPYLYEGQNTLTRL